MRFYFHNLSSIVTWVLPHRTHASMIMVSFNRRVRAQAKHGEYVGLRTRRIIWYQQQNIKEKKHWGSRETEGRMVHLWSEPVHPTIKSRTIFSLCPQRANSLMQSVCNWKSKRKRTGIGTCFVIFFFCQKQFELRKRFILSWFSKRQLI